MEKIIDAVGIDCEGRDELGKRKKAYSERLLRRYEEGMRSHSGGVNLAAVAVVVTSCGRVADVGWPAEGVRSVEEKKQRLGKGT
ncbi:unnamed protein product [Linum trigynum]|uniref:Uncharacterized protein n=1 Tax=Linum trigynum TaxID=586398 RepID=A0AAV2FF62_9ROSI